ncbi:MAG: hypothetical protein EBU90_22760 [Proteobacteria bacterium]|nr:hypothetical protein [Pseudomonadota bacterium]
MKQILNFKIFLGLSAFSLASCAAFFSVKGIALLFSASFWSVILMAGSLEFAKLISASYLYRYWDKMNKILKNYMLIAVLLLMCITSLGIFGFLSDAFQRNFSQYSLNVSKIQALKSNQAFISSQVDFNKNKLKDLIELQKTYQSSLDNVVKQNITVTKTSGGGLFSSVRTEEVTDNKLLDSRNKIIEHSQQNIHSLFSQIQVTTSELQNLERKGAEITQDIIILESENSKGDIGTFKFVSEAVGLSVETAVRIFIILLVIVFDPLAVCLVIAYNSSFEKNKILNEKQVIEETIEKPTEKVINVVQYHQYKRGTKKEHNANLADPYLKANQTKL